MIKRIVAAAFFAALTCLGGGPLDSHSPFTTALFAAQADPEDVKIKALLQRTEQVARTLESTAG